MHHIQYKIIDQLIYANTRRFSELRPRGVDSNLFQYHLQHTIKEGYVQKVEDGYTLSPKGLYFADRHSSLLKDVREQPKVITIVAIRDSLGRILLKSKDKQPFVGTYHLPAGKLHMNESLHQAAVRELQEKTPITDLELTHVLTVHVRISMNNQLISEYIAFIYTGTTAQLADSTLWYDIAQPGSRILAPSVAEILQMLDSPSPTLHEIEVQL